MKGRLIAYPPNAAALTQWSAPGERLRIGRDHDCDLYLDHPSVSRHHAEMRHTDGAWRLRDLGSKNGCFVDGRVIHDHPLPHACWLRFGDIHCEFAQFDDAQAAKLCDRNLQRRNLSAVMTQQLAGQARFDLLLDEVLRGVLDLAGCSRGFLLLADGDDFVVSASLVTDSTVLDQHLFSGSIGAVQRVLSQGKAVVVNHVGSEAWLAERASVIGTGLQTLVCLPLRDGSQVFGAVYADRRSPGEPITEFDLELLDTFAESAALYLLARRALRRLNDAPRWSAIVQAQATGTRWPAGNTR